MYTEPSCRSAFKQAQWVPFRVKSALNVCKMLSGRWESGITPSASQLRGCPSWPGNGTRLNATKRKESLIGLRVQYVRSCLDVRHGERDGVGSGDTRRHSAPHWMRGRNEGHPKPKTSSGRVAFLWKQLSKTSHPLAMRETGPKHLGTQHPGGERPPMFARSTSAPVISVPDMSW